MLPNRPLEPSRPLSVVTCRRSARLSAIVMPTSERRRSGLRMQADLLLRRPRQDEEEEFLRAHRATSPEVPYFLRDR